MNNGTRLHVMPEERSHDIDSELDWSIVTHLHDLANGLAADGGGAR